MKKVLLFTTALSLSFIQHTSLAQSACVSTPSCAELGYNASSCPNGGLKCPFGNTWNCEITNYKDKITELEKEIEEQENELKNCINCKVGDILYSDMSTSPKLISGKTPIGIVFDPVRKLAIALEEKKTSNPNRLGGSISYKPTITADWQGKTDTQANLKYCQDNNLSCPAFEYATTYKTEGTNAGDWYLPAAGELMNIISNAWFLEETLIEIGGQRFTLQNAGDYGYLFSTYGSIGSFTGITMDYDATLGYARLIINFSKTEPEQRICEIGDILYSDKTCSSSSITSNGKIPIAIVFEPTKRLAIALNVSTRKIWQHNDGLEYDDIPNLANITSTTNAENDWQGKENTRTAIKFCNTTNLCPAFEYVNSYKTEGTQAGDWYLPAAGELKAITDNINMLNISLKNIGQNTLSTSGDYFWSSSEYSNKNAWCFDNKKITYCGKYYNSYTIPVLAY